MVAYSFGQYFRDQWSNLPIPRAFQDDVNSKVFMVTGSNVGLGFEASVHLANMKPKALIVTSRDQAKCKQTRESVLERAAASGTANTQVLGLPLEMGTFQDVRTFVDTFAADENATLDVLVANAGLRTTSYTPSQDGWEMTLQVNYLSTALLSILLLPYLIDSSSPNSPSRLVIVSSFTHYFHKLKGVDSWDNILETINKRENGHKDMYPISKLLVIIFVRELASRLPGSTPVIVCSVNPGFCKSNIFRGSIGEWTAFVLGKLFSVRSTEEGSRTLVHAAVASDRSMHGRYLSSCQVTEEDDFLFTPEGKAFASKVWDETITLLSGIDGRVSDVVQKYLRTDS